MSLLHRAWRVVAAKPWLSAVVVVIVAGAAGGYFLLSGGGSGSDAAAAAATTSQLINVSTGTVTKSVTGSGSLTPLEKDVSFASAAEITSVRVAQGDTVAKGQVLGTINALSLQADLAQARSTLATARASLASAEDSSATTSAQLSADKASVQTAAQSVTSARTSLAGATLRSPIAGVVAEVNVTKGDQSSGGSGTGASAGSSAGSAGGGSSSSGTDATSTGSSSSSGDFVIIGTSSWTVSVDVDDTEIGLIAKGQQAQLTTDNHNGTIFGTVTAVSVLSSSTSGSATYPVTVSVTGSPSGLHDGADATVAIIYRQATNVLTVASAAIHGSGTGAYVYVSSNGKKVKRSVHTGIVSTTTTQITSGLKSGEQVYVDITRPGGGFRRSSTSGSGTTNQFSGGGAGGFPGGGTGGFPGGGFGGGSGGGS